MCHQTAVGHFGSRTKGYNRTTNLALEPLLNLESVSLRAVRGEARFAMTRARASNSIDHMEEEAESLRTVDQVADWAALGISQVAGGPRQPDPARDSLYALLGLTRRTSRSRFYSGG
jgi:hypothetical protein